MAYKIIPLTSDPDQKFSCNVPIGDKNKNLIFRFRYNTEGEYWWMSVTDANSGIMLLDAIPLFPGEYPSADILGQYQYLNIGSACLVKADKAGTEVPNDENLGSTFVLVWGDAIG